MPSDRKPSLIEQITAHKRFATVAFAVALPAIYGAFIWSKASGGFPRANWLMVAILPLAICGAILGCMNLASASAIQRAQAEETPGETQ